MKIKIQLELVFKLLLLGSVVATQSANASLIFNDRTSFENTLTDLIVDDYENPAYVFTQSNAQMSSVLGETQYTSTGFTDLNLVPGGVDKYYCAGCNGSFLLDFTSTSIGSASGVFGVGFEIVGSENSFNTTAFVTFGNGSTMNYLLPDANNSTGNIFWGITDNLLISSIHFGLPNGGANTVGNTQRVALDNLTIGTAAAVATVPTPTTLPLFCLGFLLLSWSGRKKYS